MIWYLRTVTIRIIIDNKNEVGTPPLRQAGFNQMQYNNSDEEELALAIELSTISTREVRRTNNTRRVVAIVILSRLNFNAMCTQMTMIILPMVITTTIEGIRFV